MPHIASAMDQGLTTSSELLAGIKTLCQDPVLDQLRVRIDTLITEDTSWCRAASAARNHEVFAIRPDIDGSLDAVREVYTANVQAVINEGDRLRADWALPGLKLNYSSARGHHLHFPPAAAAALPAGVIQAVKSRGGAVSATTDEVLNLNYRIKENLQQAYTLMDGVLMVSSRGATHAQPALRSRFPLPLSPCRA